MPRLENADSFANASVATILETARNVIEYEVDGHPVFGSSEHGLDDMPLFYRDEIVEGRVVGRGGFCVVKEIKEIRLHSKSIRGGCTETGNSGDGDVAASFGKFNLAGNRNVDPLIGTRSSLDRSLGTSSRAGVDTDIASREFMARRVLAKRGGKFVVKKVEPELLNTDRVTYLKGIIDLAMEAQYLATMDHPNILKLRGVCCHSPYQSTGYFLVLDHLQVTLPKKLNAWMLQDRATKGITGFMTGGSAERLWAMTI